MAKIKKGFLRRLLAPLWTGHHRFTTLSVLIICAMYAIVVFYNTADKSGGRLAALVTKTNGVQSSQVTSVGQPHIGGPFRLQQVLADGSSKVFTEQDLEDKVSMIFFGFTHCPDICPNELSKYVQVMDKLTEEEQANVQAIFVSVDPKRDNPQQLVDYVTSFDERFIGLTGTPEQVKHAADAYLVYYVLHAPKPGDEDYTVDHSGYTYIMDKSGTYTKHFNIHTSVDDVLAGVRQALKK